MLVGHRRVPNNLSCGDLNLSVSYDVRFFTSTVALRT